MAITKKTKNRKRSRAHGFLARKSTTTGRKVIANRRKKGRKNLITV